MPDTSIGRALQRDMRLSAVRRRVRLRELLGVFLWVGAVGVIYGTLALPFQVHLLLIFIWLVLSGLAFVMLSRSSLSDTEAVSRDSVRRISDAQEEMIARMATYSEARDSLTGEHIHRVRAVATAIAAELGMPEEEARAIGRAAVAHDLGKIGIPDAVLGKPGRLEPDEFEVVKTHTIIGEGVLGGSPLFELERQCARHHHEWWDGNGYPDGLVGEEIPLVARIASVADVYDALLSKRPYKEPWPAERAVDLLQAESGTHFDPAVVEAFLRIYERGQVPRQAARAREEAGVSA